LIEDAVVAPPGSAIVCAWAARVALLAIRLAILNWMTQRVIRAL
jgi:hypothetical protein